MTELRVTLFFFLSFLLGVAITAVALVGTEVPLKCYEAGSDADWWAAIGTWAIGVMAAYIAVHSSKEAAKRELERAKEDDRKRVAHLVSARALMADPSTAALVMRRFIDRPSAERTWRRMRISMESTLMSVQHLNFTSEMMAHLPHEAIKKYVTICHQMRAVRYMFDTPDAFSPEGVDQDSVVSAALIDGWNNTLKFASNLERDCQEFFRLLDAEIHEPPTPNDAQPR
ncbi:hypothetical protein [Stenotrophomonas maltophilia]